MAKREKKSRGDPVTYVDDHSIWGMRYDRWRVDAPLRGYYTAGKRREWDEYQRAVTPWELERNLAVL